MTRQIDKFCVLLTIVFFILAAHGVALQIILYISSAFKIVNSCENVLKLSMLALSSDKLLNILFSFFVEVKCDASRRQKYEAQFSSEY